MAKKTIDFIASNAVILFDEMKIVELPKKKDDQAKVYDLAEVLKEFNGLEGVSFSISTKEEIEPISNEY